MSNHPAASENILFIVLVSCAATIGGFLFGFDSGVINGTVDGLKTAFHSDNAGTGFNVASMLLGCALGAFIGGRLADRYGRRSVLLVTALLFLLSAFGSGYAGGSTEFVLYRIIGGIAVGGASVIVPAYISEITPARFRGMLATVQQIAIISGLFMAFVSNYLLAQHAGASTAVLWLGFEAWRWMFWMMAIPALLFFIMLLLIPESPRFLAIRRDRAGALKVLNRLYRGNQGEQVLRDIEASLDADHAPKLRDIFIQGSRKIRPIVWVGIGLAVFQQLVGINVIFYYGAVLWQAVGFSEADALLINILSGGLSIAACLITLVLIDKVGRKPFLMLGSIGMSVTLLLVTYAFANSGSDADGNLQLGNLGTLALVSANAYVFFFNMSWGPVMWVMLGEMFPNQIRGSALAVSGLAQWLANFAITMSFPLMLGSIGLAGAYGFYALCALLSIGFVWFSVQETKGKALEQMQG